MSVGFTLEGVADLSKELEKLENMQWVKEAIKVNTAAMQNEAQWQVPVDTGNLKRSLSIEITDGGYTGRLYTNAEYALHVEYGTRFMGPQPYIRPALKHAKAQLKYDLLAIEGGV